MCGTSNALQMDWTAFEDELCDGPNIATTPKDSWSQARMARTEGELTLGKTPYHDVQQVSRIMYLVNYQKSIWIMVVTTKKNYISTRINPGFRVQLMK
jgi:hypothetical protein